MSTRQPELEGEQEVDLARYWNAIVARWWLALAGLVAGALIGYAVSLGGADVWRASATVYLGQPYSVVSSVALLGKQANPATVGEIVRSEESLQAAAAAAAMRPEELRGHVSTRSISSGTGVGANRTTANPLVRITVEVSTSRRARVAANALARQVVAKLSGYATRKIEVLQRRIASDQRVIDLVERQLTGGSDQATKAILGVSLGQVFDDQLNAQGQLTQAQEVELPSVLTRAAAVKTTARSRRNSVVVAAFIGLLIGLVAALAWEPVAARWRS